MVTLQDLNIGEVPYVPGIPIKPVEREPTLSEMKGPAVLLVFGNSTALACARLSKESNTVLAVLFTWDISYKVHAKGAVKVELEIEGTQVQWGGLRHVIDDMCLGQHLRRGVTNGQTLDDIIGNRRTKQFKDCILLNRFQPLMVSWRPAEVASSEEWQTQVARCLV